MKIQLKRIDDDSLFECTNANGHTMLMDNSSKENAQGISPMESILMAVAGCSGIDVVAILKKQRQKITDFQAEVEGIRVQVDEAKPFKQIKVIFRLEGDIDITKANKAAALSFDKYCSVSKTLEPHVEVIYEIYVNGEKA